jgi:uncharacterized membrane protein
VSGNVRRLSVADLRATLWFWPSVAVVVSVLTAPLFLRLRPPADGGVLSLEWVGDHDAVRALLQVIATSVVTVTGLTFSLVVVAIQLASQQFSPRLLREFARDTVIQLSLGVLVSTFAYSATVLLSLDSSQELPRVAVVVAYLLALASLAALLAFIGHIVRAVRVDTMMLQVHAETAATIRQFYPPHDAPPASDPQMTPPQDGQLLRARHSGFCRVIRFDELVAAAQRADAVLFLLVRPGDHVVAGTPLAAVASRERADLPPALDKEVADAVELGFERTFEQDTGYGLRQLTDIAVKAMSPGINDPATAAHALGYAADLLTRLCGRRLGGIVHSDGDGAPRVLFPGRDLGYYVGVVCGQVRRYGAREPTVLVALLRMLRDAATSARDDEQRAVLRSNAELVAAMADDDLPDADKAAVAAMLARVDAALSGDVLRAYADRSGEFRSM